MRWEYRILSLEYSNVIEGEHFNSTHEAADALEKLLDKFGRHGWELVSHTSWGFIFKRPIE